MHFKGTLSGRQAGNAKIISANKGARKTNRKASRFPFKQRAY